MSKRIFDIVFTLIGLALLWPILLCTALAIKWTSKGPVFYRGERVGYQGQLFKIFKFRTMVVNADKIGGPSTALNDSRLTSIGNALRKYKLDELPQLFNILAGDMSIVGPRPQVKHYVDLYTKEEQKILDVKPGLTDFASIHFIDMDTTLGDGDVDKKYLTEVEPIKNKLRLKYVEEISLLTDIKLILKTITLLTKSFVHGIFRTRQYG